MTNKSARPSPIAPLGGVVVGIAVFLGVNITTGCAIIPDAGVGENHGRAPLPPVVYPKAAAAIAAGPAGPYQTVCATCHQAEGTGHARSVPATRRFRVDLGNPEVPIRIVLAGLDRPDRGEGHDLQRADAAAAGPERRADRGGDHLRAHALRQRGLEGRRGDGEEGARGRSRVGPHRLPPRSSSRCSAKAAAPSPPRRARVLPAKAAPRVPQPSPGAPAPTAPGAPAPAAPGAPAPAAPAAAPRPPRPQPAAAPHHAVTKLDEI